MNWVCEFKKYDIKQDKKYKYNYNLVMDELYISGNKKFCKTCKMRCLNRRMCCNWVCESCEITCYRCNNKCCMNCIDVLDTYMCCNCVIIYNL